MIIKTLAAVMAVATLVFLIARVGEYWICGKCGTQNGIYTSICKECGASK